MISIFLDKISISLNDTVILRDVTVKIDEREILGIIGPNGSGKSILLSAILGVHKHLSGHMHLGDTCIDDLEIYERGEKGILLVPQSLHQFWMAWHPKFCGFRPGVTVLENVCDIVKSNSRALEWLEIFGLDLVKGKDPSHLSWGQQQRLAVIRMCAFKPKVLLLDEPFAATDWRIKKELKLYIRKYLKQNDIATIFTSSDPDTTKGFCDSIVQIKDLKLTSKSKIC